MKINMDEEQQKALEILLKAAAPHREREMTLSLKRIEDCLCTLSAIVNKINNRQIDYIQTIEHLEFVVEHLGFAVKCNTEMSKKIIDTYEEIVVQLRKSIKEKPQANKEETKANPDTNPALLIRIDHLELRPRIIKALNNYLPEVVYVGDLVTKHPRYIKRTPNLGIVSFKEIEAELRKMDLKFNMHIPDWPQGDID
jgi:DNA-directed RNA polymerase alpha subunit